MSEKELIKEAIKKNRAAQANLYHQYKTSWFMICMRYNKNRYDAEDCLQSGLVSIFSKLSQFDAKRGTFKSWSHRIIVNANIQHLKKQQLFRHAELVDEYLTNDNEADESIEPLTTESMIKLVQQLPPGYRSIFNLYVMEGFTHREISEILDISVGTSKSQLAKGKRMLRNQLELVLKTVY